VVEPDSMAAPGSMAAPILRIENLAKNFGGLRVTDDVTLDVRPGELHAVIGPNGAGKTTLINQISGLLAPDAGRILFGAEDVTRLPVHARAARGLARSFQITSILPRFSVLENVALAVQARTGTSFRFFGRAADEEALNAPAMAALAQVGLAQRAAAPAGELSHGEKRALELAIALAMEPKLLLLDEPMAGTGRDETERLVAALRALKGRFPMVLVEHDMEAVFALADRISVLIYGRILASGTPDEVRADPRVVTAYLGEEME
jgi:branched-chain amino acid transport system ATP-binding protein